MKRSTPTSRKLENALVLRAQAGDREAQEALLAKYERLCWKLALRVTGRGEEALDDRLQVARLALWKAITQFDPARKVALMSYVFTSVQQTLFTHVSRAGIIRLKTHRLCPDIAALRCVSLDAPSLSNNTLGDEIVDEFDPTDEDRRYDDVRAVHHAIDRLPARLAKIIRRRLAGDKLREIAQTLGVGKERVRQLESRAKSQLADMLRERMAG